MALVVARCGSDVLVEEGPRLVFGRQPGSGAGTLLYVLGLIAFTLGGNGLFWLVQGVAGGPGLLAGVILVGLAAAVVAGFVLALRARRAAREHPLLPNLVLDFAASSLLNAEGRPLAALRDVTFARVWQVASSSRALELRWGGERRVVLRGSPFAGSVDPAAARLRSRGIAEG